jgi:hypothetical protein
MIWSHQSVYDALVKNPNFSNTINTKKKIYVNPYVCITTDQEAGNLHSMILYSPLSKDSGAKKRPYQYDNKRPNFDPVLQKKLKPFLESKYHETNQGKNWFKWKIKPEKWGEFAAMIGLVDY